MLPVVPPSSLPRRRLLLALVACGASLRIVPAWSAAFPQRPVHLVVPSAVGGGSDGLARLLQPPLAALLGEPIVLDYRPGAAGRIAYEHVAQSPADGYTVLLTNNGTQNSVAGGERQLAPVSLLARSPVVIVAHPRLRITSLSALVELARREPGRVACASGTIGSTSHLAVMMLSKRAGIAMQNVPYAGTAAGLKDVLSGEVPIMFTQLGTVGGLLDAGTLQPLAVTSERRLLRYPQIPTVAESGYAGFAVGTWYGVMVPAATPASIVAALHETFVRALATDDVRRALPALGMESAGSTPEAFAAVLEAELQRSMELMRIHESARP